MSKWTQGKWEYDEETKVVGDGTKIIVDPLAYTDDTALCRYRGLLIAAAPEMADLLDDARAALESGEAETRSFVALQIRALLSRIKGGCGSRNVVDRG